MIDLVIIDNPARIYNIDEKGCRLCLHHQQKVLTEKGTRRVHIVRNEHGEYITICTWDSSAVPPMILFKGKRMKPERKDVLPTWSRALMTQKGSATVVTFGACIEHFSTLMVAGPCLFIFQLSKVSFYKISTILLWTQPQNLILCCTPSLVTITKKTIGLYFQKWDKINGRGNIKSGFAATEIYSFNK
ncbi:hypothetical protein NQ318_007717 [Aromia moschata]|uniref:Uncharacterized protein n=1 Tax=Aromia moschata TaxID=1265417 RepID=A0AAV8Z0X6_9CUCU|nr:hypothetical protein NQ318_007717 [Aromia moschata]